MPAFAVMTLQDQTPANVTFNPQSIEANVARWIDAQSVFDAKKSVTHSVSAPKGGSAVSRVRQRVTVPIMDAVDTTKKIGEIIVNVDAVIPKVSSEAQRLLALALVKTLLAHANTTAAYQSIEGVY